MTMTIVEFLVVLYIALGIFSGCIIYSAWNAEFPNTQEKTTLDVAVAGGCIWPVGLPLNLFLFRKAIFGKNKMCFLDRYRAGQYD